MHNLRSDAAIFVHERLDGSFQAAGHHIHARRIWMQPVRQQVLQFQLLNSVGKL